MPPPGLPPIRPSEPGAASRRVRRNRWFALVLVALIATGVAVGLNGGNGPKARPPHHPRAHHSGTGAHTVKDPQLDADWQGDGKPVTFAFGGDVNFPSGSVLGDRLAADPATALGTGVPALLSGVNLSMVNFESALTNGNCPQPQPKSYVFDAPPSAVTAFRSANVSLVTEANNHGEDCGPQGLQMALSIRNQSGYTILGLGQNVGDAFTPFRTTINGQRITIIAATQVIDSDLQTTWTATLTQPGLASAYDVSDLVAAVEAARKDSDTVIVFLHWGIELQACPDPVQEPTSWWGATRTSCSAGATSGRPTWTTAWATSRSTTTLRPPTRAGRW
jgi:hypothetical protein